MNVARSTYRAKCAFLLAAGILVVWLFWHKRFSASLHQWQATRSMRADLAHGDHRAEALARTRAQLVAADRMLGSTDRAPDDVWRSVLAAISDLSSSQGIALHSVDEELGQQQGTLDARVLPVTLRGRFTALLRSASELQRHVPEARITSLHFHLDKGQPGRPQWVLMTLYLQTFRHHA